MAKKIYFGTNLKMYKGNADVIKYLSELSDLSQSLQKSYNAEIFVIPSFTSLKDAVETINLKHSSIIIGAQNMNPNDNGQFTGDISPLMLKELGIRLVMIGHSERRHIFRETDEEENAKVLSSLKHGFITLLCIGETAEQKNYDISDEILRTQLKIALHGVELMQLDNLWIAYEPVWAIGTGGTPASAEYADNKHAVIKQCLFELFGEDSKKIPVLYGGSVNPNNANTLIEKPNIDGLFTGRSAWNAKAFSTLIFDALKTAEQKKIIRSRTGSESFSVNEYTGIARDLLSKLGGVENIAALTHCATRIRVVPYDPIKVDKIGIDKIDKSKGVFTVAGNQYQIIFGVGIVEKVYEEMLNLISNKSSHNN